MFSMSMKELWIILCGQRQVLMGDPQGRGSRTRDQARARPSAAGRLQGQAVRARPALPPHL